MNYYIIDSDQDVIAYGFKSEKEAENYIWNEPYLSQYWWRYEIKECSFKEGWGVVTDRDCVEHGGTAFRLFETWDDAAAYACDYILDLPKDFDFDADIFSFDITQRG